MRSGARFRYALDPMCWGSIAIYAVNRWLLKPNNIGGAFTQGYVNDLLCLPLFLPLILYVQRLLHLRDHDDYPHAWEIIQHWAVFSIVFEVIIPRLPEWYRSTADPWDVLAYAVGGAAAGWYWSQQRRRAMTTNNNTP